MKVTFCSLNVLGRELTSTDGRSHGDNHAVSLIVGPNVKAGVAGGISGATAAKPHSARVIDGATGSAGDGGDVTFDASLAPYAKTLVVAAGVEDATTNNVLRTGTTAAGALAG